MKFVLSWCSQLFVPGSRGTRLLLAQEGRLEKSRLGFSFFVAVSALRACFANAGGVLLPETMEDVSGYVPVVRYISFAPPAGQVEMVMELVRF